MYLKSSITGHSSWKSTTSLISSSKDRFSSNGSTKLTSSKGGGISIKTHTSCISENKKREFLKHGNEKLDCE